MGIEVGLRGEVLDYQYVRWEPERARGVRDQVPQSSGSRQQEVANFMGVVENDLTDGELASEDYDESKPGFDKKN